MAGAKVDVMDFKLEEDDLIDDDTTMDDGNAKIVPTHVLKLKSSITCSTSQLNDGGPDNTNKRSFRKETNVELNSFFAAQKVGIPELQISLFWA
jgi:hypothetical protein